MSAPPVPPAAASPRLAGLYRYPVKGLTGEALASVMLEPDQGVPSDRRFALAHASAPLDPAAPDWLERKYFLMLAANPRLAALEAHFDHASSVLTLRRDQRQVARGDLSQPLGRLLIEQFLAAYLKDETRGRLNLVAANGFHFTDSSRPFVSLINLASLKDLETRIARRALEPARFRANLHMEGLAPWAEHGLVGREIAIGPARFRVRDLIERCAATSVNPSTGERDVNLPHMLKAALGQPVFGVFASVVAGGHIAPGDSLSVVD
jgi:MOSC domain-containing protein